MRPFILKPWVVSLKKDMVTISISSIMASDETTAIDRGVLLLLQENNFPSLNGWEEKATLL